MWHVSLIKTYNRIYLPDYRQNCLLESNSAFVFAQNVQVNSQENRKPSKDRAIISICKPWFPCELKIGKFILHLELSKPISP